MLNSYFQQFAQLLSRQFKISEDTILEQITLAPDNIEGDLAFPTFKFSKQFWKNPAEFAKDIAEKMHQHQNQLFSSFIAVGPYINAIINQEFLAKSIITTIKEKKSDYGKGSDTGKQILLEGRQPNTHKAIHIGHIRNILVSESLSRIFKFAGNEVIKCAYPGDIGAHVAKWIRYYINFDKSEFPTQNFTKRIGEIYTAATRKVDENPDLYKEQIHTLQKNLEDGDTELVKIWKETRELCLTDMKKIFSELGSSDIDKRYFESEVEQPGINIVKELQQKGIAQISQGALAINLEKHKLGRFLLLKSNGASLYSTKDIALAYKKREEYPNYDDSVYVVGSEQIYHFEQLFKTLEIIGFDHSKLKHLAYGLVDLKDGKMSSRDGNVVLYEDFRDQLLDKAHEMMESRDISQEQKKQTAHAVAFAAMKFGMLLQDSEKKITFDETQALSFEGETGPYLQYTYARINSILKKSKEGIAFTEESINYSLLSSDEEKKLLIHLAGFENEIQKAAQQYKPNYVARFCLDLAQLFNSYYHNSKIIDESNLELSKARLALIKTVQQGLENWLNLLGIEVVEAM